MISLPVPNLPQLPTVPDLPTLPTMLAAFLMGLMLLPLVALAAGRRAARQRRMEEARHRHPRPALRGNAAEPMDPLRAYADGRRAGVDTYRGVEDLVANLRERHRLRADVGRQDDSWHVRLTGLSADTAARGGPSCDYDRGILAEAFTRLAGSPVEIQEVSCGADGTARCEFAIRPLTRPGSGDAKARARKRAENPW